MWKWLEREDYRSDRRKQATSRSRTSIYSAITSIHKIFAFMKPNNTPHGVQLWRGSPMLFWSPRFWSPLAFIHLLSFCLTPLSHTHLHFSPHLFWLVSMCVLRCPSNKPSTIKACSKSKRCQRRWGCVEWPLHLFLSQQGTRVQSIKQARLSFIAS